MASWPDRFFLEFSCDEACPLAFQNDPVILLFFQSWAYSADFGGTHELALAATHLRKTLKVDMKPLVRYADRNVDNEADRQEFERSWQPAAPLAASARAVAEH